MVTDYHISPHYQNHIIHPHTPTLYSHMVYTLSFRYNGCLPDGDKGRRRSKFALCRRSHANGVKPVKHHVVKNAQQHEVCLCEVKKVVVAHIMSYINIIT